MAAQHVHAHVLTCAKPGKREATSPHGRHRLHLAFRDSRAQIKMGFSACENRATGVFLARNIRPRVCATEVNALYQLTGKVDDDDAHGSRTRCPSRGDCIAKLGKQIARTPGNTLAVKKLLNMLNRHMPTKQGLGKYSDCQIELARRFPDGNRIDVILWDGNAVARCKERLKLVDARNLHPSFAVTRLCAGHNHAIGEVATHCERRLSLFKEAGVISKICMDR